MTQLLAEHGAHLGFVVIGVIAFLWTAYRPERGSDDRVRDAAPTTAVTPLPCTPAPATVRRSVARRGLLALGPLLGAVATGAILYGIEVGGASVPGAVIWVHSGISALALLLVAYKVADLGMAQIRRAFTRQRLPELISIILAALSIPLLVTGVGLVLAPSTQSFIAYSHLISSAWWTGLMLWHLRRYLGPSLRAVRRRHSTERGHLGPAGPQRSIDPGGNGRPAPSKAFSKVQTTVLMETEEAQQAMRPAADARYRPPA